MKTISKKRLKQLAKTYRKTKCYPVAAEIAEYRHLQENWNKVEKLWKSPFGLSLENAISIQIGLWQHEHGFYLTSRQAFGKRKK